MTARTCRAGRTTTTAGTVAALAAATLLGAPPGHAGTASAGLERAPVTAWVASTAGAVAVPVRLATGRVGEPAAVEDPQSSAFAPDGRTLWLTTSGSLSLVPLDTATRRVGPGAPVVTFGPVALTGDGRTAWVGDADQEGGEVLQRVDLASRAVRGVGLGGGGAADLALTADGRQVVLSGALFDGRRGLFQVRTRDGALVRHLPDAGPGALAVAPDGRTLYAALAAGVVEVDVATGRRGRTLGTAARDLAGAPDGRVLWLATDAGVVPVDLRTGRAGAPLAGTSGAVRLELAPSGDRAVVALRGGDGRARAAEVDLAAGTVTPLGVDADADTFAVTPSQAPVAALAVEPGAAGSPTVLDASASRARTGRLVRYDWRFGDGTGARTATPQVRHVYDEPGTYRVVVRVTDSTGTSTTQVHTGRQVLRNGGPQARTARTVVVS